MLEIRVSVPCMTGLTVLLCGAHRTGLLKTIGHMRALFLINPASQFLFFISKSGGECLTIQHSCLLLGILLDFFYCS